MRITGRQNPYRLWKKQLDTWRGERGCLIPALERVRIANMVRELETFEQNLASWQQTICDEEERERDEAAARGKHTALHGSVLETCAVQP